jgi:acetate kinase
MLIMVINSGSSSLKFALINMETRNTLCKGLLERIGLSEGIINYEAEGKEKVVINRKIADHNQGIKIVLDFITGKETGVINDIKEIKAVGHRIVHGGEKISKAILLDNKALDIVKECYTLAPLHNPANYEGIAAFKSVLPDVPHVGVFDTAYHATIPKPSYIYALPYEYYEKHGIRRFGFHGPSHNYVSLRASEILNIDYDNFNCITCHMGNGVSLTAIKGGKSVDTSLGFGTMCGVPMGTRAGDIDPAIMLHLISELGLSPDEVHDIIYKKSGLLGISGLTNDMRDIFSSAKEGNERASLAIEIFTSAVRGYIAKLATKLGGRVDAIIFTAGIGENSIESREMICRDLEFMGVNFDFEKNNVRGEERIISKDKSPVKVMVVPTNEELMIALDTKKIAESLL